MSARDSDEKLKILLAQRVVDSISEHAQAYGRKTTNPIDIIYALCTVEETHDVLRRRGVDTRRMLRDISVIETYGWQHILGPSVDMTPQESTTDIIIQESVRIAEMLRSLDATVQVREAIKEKHPDNYETIINDFFAHMALLALGTPPGDRFATRSNIQESARITICTAIGHILKNVLGDDANLSGELTGLLVQITENLVIKPKGELSDQFGFALEHARGGSPTSIIDLACSLLDSKHMYLFYRNGLLAPDGYVSPLHMPEDGFLNLIHTAQHIARERRDSQIALPHVFLALLQEPQIVSLLRGHHRKQSNLAATILGPHNEKAVDLTKFTRQVTHALLGQEVQQEKFRFHPTVAPNLYDLMGRIIATDPSVKPLRINKDFARRIAQRSKTGKLQGLFANPILKDEDLSSAALFLNLINRPDIEEACKFIPAWAEIKKAYEEDFLETSNKAVEEQTAKKKKDVDQVHVFKVSDRELHEALEEYATDLVALARQGKLDPVIGREQEMGQVISTLMRRNRANPILIGEPGVGKTAIPEGLAQRIAAGNVPKELVGARFYRLEMAKMSNDAIFRGQFEGRLVPIIEGISERNAVGDKPPILLFMDEVHAGMQAGNASGTPGAGEILKPALASRHVRLISSTTFGDYNKTLIKDAALKRRLTPVFIDPPSLSDTQIIVRGVREGFTGHHHIDIPDTVADRIATLAERYLPERSNPDISIEIMDAACVEARITGALALQAEHVLTVVERMAHLPPGFLRQNDRQRYLTVEEVLNNNVYDQPRATKVLGQSMKVSSAGIGEPNRPAGIFGFVGPTGVGKTETADALAQHLGLSLTKLDMSQFMERHTVAGLIGAPPGYVGYEDEGLLTGPVRRRPFNVILLDEFEKAHKEIFKILMPVFDNGVINDAALRRVDFRHTIIILSMNLDAHKIFENFPADPENWTETDHTLIRGAFHNKLKELYPPEFINRLDETVIFNPLRPRTMFKIAERELNKLKRRTSEAQNVSVTFDQAVIEKLGADGYSPEYGARPLKRLITQEVTVPLADAILTHPIESPVRTVHFLHRDERYVMDLECVR